MPYHEYTEVVSCAAASDGGSLAILLSGPQGRADFTLVRSIAARGTELFGRVRAEDGALLSAADTQQLCRCLRRLFASMPVCADLVAEFIRVAEQPAV